MKPSSAGQPNERAAIIGSRARCLRTAIAVDVLVPDVSRFGEKHQTTGEQGWENLPPGSAGRDALLRIPILGGAAAHALPRNRPAKIIAC
jgi:hypothetical protein